MPHRAAYFFLLIMIVITAGAIFLPQTLGVVVSGLAIIVGIFILLLFFFAILHGGRGPHRSVGDVVLVAISGIFPLPVHFAILYLWIGIHNAGTADRLRDMGSAFYFSVVTWTTLGYGDIVPSPDARLLVIVEAALGYVVMALLIAALVEALKR